MSTIFIHIFREKNNRDNCAVIVLVFIAAEMFRVAIFGAPIFSARAAVNATLFSQTDDSASSQGSWYDDNWYQLGRGFAGPVHIIFGNNDADLFRITVNAQKYPQIRIHGEFFRTEFDGKSVAAAHYDNIARPLALSGEFDLVAFGHNHVYEIVRTGRSLLVNPGPIMGAKFGPGGDSIDVPSTFIIYDTASGAAKGYELAQCPGDGYQARSL